MLLHPTWSALPQCGGRWGMERWGRENRLQVWEGMKSFHGNLCLPADKVALQIPQAPFPRTLKPDVRKAEMLWGRKGESKRLEAKLCCWNWGAGSQATLETPSPGFL